MEAVARRIERVRKGRLKIRLALNFGPNKDTPPEQVAADYAALMRTARRAGGFRGDQCELAQYAGASQIAIAGEDARDLRRDARRALRERRCERTPISAEGRAGPGPQRSFSLCDTAAGAEARRNRRDQHHDHARRSRRLRGHRRRSQRPAAAGARARDDPASIAQPAAEFRLSASAGSPAPTMLMAISAPARSWSSSIPV